MVRCIRIRGKMYQDSWQDVSGLMVLCIRSMGQCIRCTVLWIRVLGCVDAYELDRATRPIKVVLILCSPVSLKLIYHLFSFPPQGGLENN